jgi:hypothetical protein
LFSSHSEVFKVQATTSVLARLGKDAYDELKYGLQRDYKIELTKISSYSLDSLHLALQDVLGAESARMLLRTINAEIARLSASEPA